MTRLDKTLCRNCGDVIEWYTEGRYWYHVDDVDVNSTGQFCQKDTMAAPAEIK